ncbi:MAG TPA: ATP-dependent protease subunit HslV [Myxococcota bacterium]|nr:ATP-dependent protease subunit HslV [Myxococcota bacterium]HOD00333.1 ATP-dependent protease subunit HslV [Myxococcota bacterium]HOH77514.1 ATP-dependent protease subunit HslV [Myxococcota bacterium]
MQEQQGSPIRGTTVICVRKGGRVVIAGDGQVTYGNTVLKGSAVKVRRAADGRVLVGFAGSTADAFTLFEKFEGKLKDFNNNLARAALELAKEWRMDKALRRLDALLIVADREKTLLLTGNGDVVEPEDGIVAIGSGGPYAQAAARALTMKTSLDAAEIAATAMQVAAGMCIYTNDRITVEEL